MVSSVWGGRCGDAVAYGGSHGGGCGVARERTRVSPVGLCWWCGCRYCCSCRYAWMGSLNAGAFVTECMVAGSGVEGDWRMMKKSRINKRGALTWKLGLQLLQYAQSLHAHL